MDPLTLITTSALRSAETTLSAVTVASSRWWRATTGVAAATARMGSAPNATSSADASVRCEVILSPNLVRRVAQDERVPARRAEFIDGEDDTSNVDRRHPHAAQYRANARTVLRVVRQIAKRRHRIPTGVIVQNAGQLQIAQRWAQLVRRESRDEWVA